MERPKSLGPFNNWPKVAPQIVVALSASWGLLCTGLVRGWSAPVLPLLSIANNESLYLEPSQRPWIASIAPLCALLGCLLISLPMQLYGRRLTLIGSSIPFMLGFFMMGMSHYANSVPLLFCGRILTGLVSGAMVPNAQIYVSECASPRIRGTLGSCTATFLALGILIAYLIGAFVEWHSLCFILGSFPLVLAIVMLFMPETPSWLLSQKYDDKAKKSLQKLRGKHTDIEIEFQRIRNNHDKGNVEQSSLWQTMSSAAVLKPLIISMALMFFQQFSGINAIIFYSVIIFQEAGSNIDQFLSSIAIAFVQLACTFVSAFLVDRFGRRILLIASGIFMAASLCVLATFFYLSELWSDDDIHADTIAAVQWLPLASLISFIVSYSIGYSAIPFLIMGEIFPSRCRNVASSIASSFNLACSFTVVRTFPDLSLEFGFYGIFWIYMICCVLGIIVVATFLPETKGKTLEDIAMLFNRSTATNQHELTEPIAEKV